jgi:uncharacterized protein YijF (DUF1287 family)
VLQCLVVAVAWAPGCGAQTTWAPRPGEPAGFVDRISEAALERTRHEVRYDGSYRSISYPGGDVPQNVGVCTDVVIRVYRELGIDLQRAVHEDMSGAFSVYPKRWGLSSPDPNIDHRRVPNLETFFSRNGDRLEVTDDPGDYLPGDLVTWDLGPLPHIGIVVAIRSDDGRRYEVVHNIGRGPVVEDILFDYEIVGHFRYYGSFESPPEPGLPETGTADGG